MDLGPAATATVTLETLLPLIHTHLPPMAALLNIYIVEDSPVIREDLIATLEELVPVRVVGTAEDEATALSWLSEPGRRVDLVIVDIFLKAGSGLGVLRAAQALAAAFPARRAEQLRHARHAPHAAWRWGPTGCSTSRPRSTH